MWESSQKSFRTLSRLPARENWIIAINCESVELDIAVPLLRLSIFALPGTEKILGGGECTAMYVGNIRTVEIVIISACPRKLLQDKKENISLSQTFRSVSCYPPPPTTNRFFRKLIINDENINVSSGERRENENGSMKCFFRFSVREKSHTRIN